MFRNIFAATAVAAATIAAPASAEPIRMFQDVWAAPAGDGTQHVIVVERVDRAGDTLITVGNGSGSTQFWIDCDTDSIATVVPGADSYPWRPVDHRLMEGWYSDVACYLN